VAVGATKIGQRPAGRGFFSPGRAPPSYSVNKGEKQGLGYAPRLPRRVCCTLFVRSPSNSPDGRGAYVRQPNLQGSDRRVRRDRRDRIAWYLLVGRDRRVALSAVWACFGLLCDVHSRIVLVDGVWAGTWPVGALRPQRVGRSASHDSLNHVHQVVCIVVSLAGLLLPVREFLGRRGAQELTTSLSFRPLGTY
jgi:hypothetical protein